MRQSTRILLAAFMSLALVGCANSIYRKKELSNELPTVITIDAKQRSILSSIPVLKSDGSVDTGKTRKFCSEPSPDVFSVVAQALSAGGSFGKSGNPASIEAALNFAFSSAEQGSTIPRTQTINMLRELMYNTCLRYLNGGINPAELSVQAVRDQRLMVSILAIEQLTGAVTPKPVTIGARGSAAAGITGEALIRLDDARKAKESAEANFKTAEDAYQKKNGDAKVCDALKGKKDDDDGLTQEQKDNIKPCDELREKRDAALSEQNRTTAIYQELSTLARSGGVTAVTETDSTAPGGIDRAHDQDVKDVALTVQNIVEWNFKDDTEVMLFCLRVLAPGSGEAALKINKPEEEQSLQSVCTRYLASDVLLANKRLEAELTVASVQIDDALKTGFEAFWTAQGGKFAKKADKDKLVAELKKVRPTIDADCFDAAATKEAALVCYNKLTTPQRNALAKLPSK